MTPNGLPSLVFPVCFPSLFLLKLKQLRRLKEGLGKQNNEKKEDRKKEMLHHQQTLHNEHLNSLRILIRKSCKNNQMSAGQQQRASMYCHRTRDLLEAKCLLSLSLGHKLSEHLLNSSGRETSSYNNQLQMWWECLTQIPP